MCIRDSQDTVQLRFGQPSGACAIPNHADVISGHQSGVLVSKRVFQCPHGSNGGPGFGSSGGYWRGEPK
eukprot:3956659-Lingulodinium_polyedra.AAC.1